MSKNIQNANSQTSELNADQVAEYLLANPSFLLDRPDVLQNLQVILQDEGVVSLTQLQTDQLREKVSSQSEQLQAILDNARRNEKIYTSFALLNIEISKANSIEVLEQCLQTHLVDKLQLETFKLILFDSNDLSASTDQISEMQYHAIIEKKLGQSFFYLGRLGKLEHDALFDDAEAKSVALIKLNSQNQTIGVLAVSSESPSHFSPDMDTSILNFLRLMLNHHVTRLCE